MVGKPTAVIFTGAAGDIAPLRMASVEKDVIAVEALRVVVEPPADTPKDTDAPEPTKAVVALSVTSRMIAVVGREIPGVASWMVEIAPPSIEKSYLKWSTRFRSITKCSGLPN